MKNGVVKSGDKFVIYVNGSRVGMSKNERVATMRFQKETGTYVGRRSSSAVAFVAPVAAPEQNKFHINKRFDFLNKAVKMVARGIQNSVVISGTGGLGKSYSVKESLVQSGMRDMSVELANAEEGDTVRRDGSFVFVKGFSTAKNLYRTLFENNGSIVVFDDCDSVLKDPVAVNLLKAALDSYDTRVISWGAESRGDDDLPRSFVFTGRVVFITNMTMDRVDQAIRSRSITVDVSMTTQEMVDRMRVIASSDSFLPEFKDSIKFSALDFIENNKDSMKEISLRTLITVSKIIAANPTDWEEMAEYLTF